MRSVLIGPAEARARMRRALAGGPLVIVAEADSIEGARAAGHAAEAWLVAPVSGEAGTTEPAAARPSADEPAFAETLTPREMQVLELMAEGLPNKAIARRLDISDQTVKFHVASIGGKLGAANRTDAVRRAVRKACCSRWVEWTAASPSTSRTAS